MSDQTAAVPPITEDAAINIRRCVTRGGSFDEVLNGIRQAHASMSEAFLAACDRLAPAEQRAAVLRTASAQLFDHIDRSARMASEIYESSSSPASRRRLQSPGPQWSESSSGRVPTRHAKPTASTRYRPGPRHVDAVVAKVRPIVDAVAEGGADAALEYGESFDGVRGPRRSGCRRASSTPRWPALDTDVRAALQVAIDRARAVHATNAAPTSRPPSRPVPPSRNAGCPSSASASTCRVATRSTRPAW
jgi:hypothetical protein